MADNEESSEESGEEPKKGSKKKLIMMVVLLLVIGYVVYGKTIGKPPPKTEAQITAEKEVADWQLDMQCSLANEHPVPEPPEGAAVLGVTTTTVEKAPEAIGPVLALDGTTLNLAGGHYLKIRLALQLPLGLPLEGKIEDLAAHENWGATASQVMLNTFANKSMDEILPTEEREKLRHEIGYETCMRSEGNATTVYFTEFVAQ